MKQKIREQKGFIQIPILITIIASILAIGALGYFGIKYQHRAVVQGIKPDVNLSTTTTSTSPITDKVDDTLNPKEIQRVTNDARVIQSPKDTKITQQQLETITDRESGQNENYKQGLSQLIVDRERNISIFENAIKETEQFALTVKATMNKYSNEPTIQQSGQELLNESNNFISISRMLISIETDRVNKLSSYISSLDLGISPNIEGLSETTQQYNNYYQQYQTSNTKITSSISSFVYNEKMVLDRLVQESKQRIENLQNSEQISDPQIEFALSTLETTLSNEENKTVAMSVITGRKERAVQEWMKENQNVFSSSFYISKFNAILSSHGLYYMMIIQ